MQNKNILYLKCQCHDHLLQVENDEDFQETMFVIWSGYHGVKLGFFRRLQWCFQILKNGTPWGDHFILQEKDRKELINFLIRGIKKNA